MQCPICKGQLIEQGKGSYKCKCGYREYTAIGHKVHELKTLPSYFQAILDGTKTFELRRNDRDFKVGDTLLLKEWNIGECDLTGPEPIIIQEQGYTGREIKKIIAYIFKGGKFGLHKNYVILGIK